MGISRSCVIALMAAALVLSTPVRALTAETGPAPVNGNYATQPGWAELVISFDGTQRRFALDTQQRNGRSCSLDGVLLFQGGQLLARTVLPDAPVCQLQLQAEGGGWRTRVLDPAVCRQHCGLQTELSGLFLPLPDACRWNAREQARANFRQHYDRRNYPQALAVLDQLQAQCGGFIDWLEADAIANDRAITQFRLGQPLQCLRTLEKTRMAAVGSEVSMEQLRSQLQLSRLEHQAYLPVARATLYNRNKCQQAVAATVARGGRQ